MRHPGKRRDTAFTLTELLVVIGILVVLGALAIPVAQRVLHRAYAVHCTSNLRGLGEALNLYLADHQGNFPIMVGARESKDSDEPAIDTVLSSYTDKSDIFRCKADHERMWETTGTSYFWNSVLNDQNAASLRFLITRDATQIPVISDKENFHKYQGIEVNILFADGSVRKEVQFKVNRQ